MKKTVTLLILAFVIQSCENKKENKTRENTKIVFKDNISTKVKTENSKFNKNLFKDIPTRTFPIIDSTNFDNFEKNGRIDNEVLKILKLETQKKDVKNLRINYKIPFSENFTTITYTYQSGDHELFTSLITINNENKVIDKLEIAYDEIAESAFQKTSKIEKGKIIITEWNWMSGEPITEIETYFLRSNGQFKKEYK